ncbi:exocyst complex component sec3 [Danaus plexippus plexippus]|uniref:Exocyst complex component sec3 n=1 Tax=Danaus plexippus plexippus TaxID=278856 RepID=A0A212FEI1_DANPL|nr:exocyst complex component sec3 [Danaus plexippus plexippus]
MKLEEVNTNIGLDPAVSVDIVTADGKAQKLSVEGGTLVLTEGSSRLRCWPLHNIKIKTDFSGGVSIEAGGETLSWTSNIERCKTSLNRLTQIVLTASLPVGMGQPSDAALAALLEDSEPDDTDAERRVKRLGDRLARLDALNVAGMLAAATEGGGAQLAAKLEAGSAAGTALSTRLSRLEALTRAAPAALHARSGAARSDAAARALLVELTEIYEWLDNPALKDLDTLSEISLATADGRARALRAAEALRNALRAERTASTARLRLGAVRERLRRLARAKDNLAALLARHLNNALIHLANEAHAPTPNTRRSHHSELMPYAPFMRWLKDMDDKAYDGLVKVYVSTWSRVHEREARVWCDGTRTSLNTQTATVDDLLDEVLTMVESTCNAEQDFCTQFFYLDVDVKSDNSDGERSEKSDGGERNEQKKNTSETKKLLGELFPALETELVSLVGSIEKHEPYGAMRALACVGRRVLGEGGEGSEVGGGEARWSRAALAAVAVAAKRGADRAVADRLAALNDAVKQAAKKPKCGILSFIPELEEMSSVCESIFARGRRADLDRWYLSLATAMLRTIQLAEHPRTPRAVVQMENYHRLHACVSSLRVTALDSLRRDARMRYSEALKQYVTQYFGRPLEKLAQFFERVGEAVASGVKEDEVCYRTAFSKHELRRLLALYPAHEVRKSLHRLYRTVEKHLSEEGGLLQVVWRAMQEEFIAQHVALQVDARIASCYPGAGLTLPLSTQDILDAFSDIAREH